MEQFGIYYLVVGILIVLDIISGLMKASELKEMSSTKLREGLYHKATYLVILALATVLQIASGQVDIGYNIPLVAPISVYIVGTEVVSILENLAAVNPELRDSKVMHLLDKSDEQ